MFQLVKIFLYISVPLAVGFGSFQYLHTIFFEPMRPGDRSTVLVEISDKLPLSEVCKYLVKQKVLRQTQSLCLFRQLKGSERPLIPGEYQLSASMTPAQILAKLERGDRHLRSVDVPFGATIWELDTLFSDIGLFKEHEFEAAATNPELLSRAGISSSSFEGYLGAGGYAFARPIEPAKVLWQMMERAEQAWLPRFTAQVEILRMSRHEVLSLASIIHKASANSPERRLVSSVYHNRLKNGMKLESVEALTYGIRDFDGIVRETDKSLPSPYNTFLNYGLPPGPILNPEADAIDAALFYVDTSNLFYGKTDDGQLVFSATLKEHKEKLGIE